VVENINFLILLLNKPRKAESKFSCAQREAKEAKPKREARRRDANYRPKCCSANVLLGFLYATVMIRPGIHKARIPRSVYLSNGKPTAKLRNGYTRKIVENQAHLYLDRLFCRFFFWRCIRFFFHLARMFYTLRILLLLYCGMSTP